MSDEKPKEKVVEFDHATPILTSENPVRDCLAMIAGVLDVYKGEVRDISVQKDAHGNEMNLGELVDAVLAIDDLPAPRETLDSPPDLIEALRIVSQNVTDLANCSKTAVHTNALQLQERLVDRILELNKPAESEGVRNDASETDANKSPVLKAAQY